jgi:hypothetical protein
METVISNEAVAVPSPGSGDGEKDSLSGTEFIKSLPIGIKSYPAITVLSPGSGDGITLIFT